MNCSGAEGSLSFCGSPENSAHALSISSLEGLFSKFTKTAAVLTIHNLGYQGWFPKDDLTLFQLPWEEFYESGLERHDSLNFLHRK